MILIDLFIFKKYNFKFKFYVVLNCSIYIYLQIIYVPRSHWTFEPTHCYVQWENHVQS